MFKWWSFHCHVSFRGVYVFFEGGLKLLFFFPSFKKRSPGRFPARNFGSTLFFVNGHGFFASKNEGYLVGGFNPFEKY